MWWILGQNSIFADKIWYLCVFICALSNYWTWLGDNWLCCLEIQYKLYWFRVLSLRFDRKSPKIGGLPFFGCLTVCEGAMVSGEWYFRYLDMIAWSAYTWYLRYVSFAPWRLENHIREKIGSAWHIGIFSRLSVLLLVSWFGAKASYWRDFRICSAFYDSYSIICWENRSYWIKFQIQLKIVSQNPSPRKTGFPCPSSGHWYETWCHEESDSIAICVLLQIPNRLWMCWMSRIYYL